MKNLVVICLLLALQSCSIPGLKMPKFKRDFTAIQQDLVKQGDFESASLMAHANSTPGESTLGLTIDLVNGKNVPADHKEQNELARNAARIVAKDLQNPGDYDWLEVEIVRQSNSGLVTQTFKQSFRFSKEEITLLAGADTLRGSDTAVKKSE